MSVKILSSKVPRSFILGLFLVAVGAQAAPTPGTAVVRKITGSATYADSLGNTLPLTEGTVLKEGHAIKTGAGATVDLFMEHNGPYLGLMGNTSLRFNKLSYEPGPLGNVIHTELDLKDGEILAHVDKLLAGSRYEILSPQGKGIVRGTDFWWSALTGEIHTIAGLVQVVMTLILNEDAFAPPGNDEYQKTFNIPASYSMFVPKQIELATFMNIGLNPLFRPGNTLPATVIERLEDGIPFDFSGHYDDGGATSQVTVEETFDAIYVDAAKKKVLLTFPLNDFQIMSN